MLQREIVGLPTTVYPVDDWGLVETQFDTDYLARTETIFSLGNGHVGIRGNVDEGRPFHERGTFVNGFLETWPKPSPGATRLSASACARRPR